MLTPASIDEPFPFMKLFPEIRNMIYRYLVVQKPDPRYPDRKQGVITILNSQYSGPFLFCETNIFTVSRQVHAEASSIFYGENTIVLDLSSWYTPLNMTFRMDKSSGGRRSLRSGRSVDTTVYSGLIYPHVIRRFQNIQLTHDSYDCSEAILQYGYYKSTGLPNCLHNISVYLTENPKKKMPKQENKPSISIEMVRRCGYGSQTHVPPASSAWKAQVAKWFQEPVVEDILHEFLKTRTISIIAVDLDPEDLKRIRDALSKHSITIEA